MSGRPKAPAATSAETAREMTRQLHEAMRDAKALLAEVRGVQAELHGTADKWRCEMNEELAGLEKHVNEQSAQVQGDLDRNGKEIQARIAELLSQDDPGKLLAVIIDSLLADIKPATIKAVVEKVESGMLDYVKDALTDIAVGRSDKAVKARAAAVVQLVYGQPADSGSLGAVPGQQGHQS